MSATLIHPDVQRERPALEMDRLPWQFQEVYQPTAETHETGVCGSMLRAVILGAIGIGAVALLMFSLTPATFVAMVVFLPVLLPFILLGLAIVFEDDVQRARIRRDEEAQLPCSCHHDRLRRSMHSV